MLPRFSIGRPTTPSLMVATRAPGVSPSLSGSAPSRQRLQRAVRLLARGGVAGVDGAGDAVDGAAEHDDPDAAEDDDAFVTPLAPQGLHQKTGGELRDLGLSCHGVYPAVSRGRLRRPQHSRRGHPLAKKSPSRPAAGAPRPGLPARRPLRAALPVRAGRDGDGVGRPRAGQARLREARRGQDHPAAPRQRRGLPRPCSSTRPASPRASATPTWPTSSTSARSRARSTWSSSGSTATPGRSSTPRADDAGQPVPDRTSSSASPPTPAPASTPPTSSATRRATCSTSSTATSSPQNVLVTIGGVTKVIDFGIAKALDRSAEATADRACSRARRSTPRPSRCAARTSTAAPTSGPSAPSSTTTSPAASPTRARTISPPSRPSPPAGRRRRCPRACPPQVAQVVMTALAPALDAPLPDRARHAARPRGGAAAAGDHHRRGGLHGRAPPGAHRDAPQGSRRGHRRVRGARRQAQGPAPAPRILPGAGAPAHPRPGTRPPPRRRVLGDAPALARRRRAHRRRGIRDAAARSSAHVGDDTSPTGLQAPPDPRPTARRCGRRTWR